MTYFNQLNSPTNSTNPTEREGDVDVFQKLPEGKQTQLEVI